MWEGGSVGDKVLGGLSLIYQALGGAGLESNPHSDTYATEEASSSS